MEYEELLKKERRERNLSYLKLTIGVIVLTGGLYLYNFVREDFNRMYQNKNMLEDKINFLKNDSNLIKKDTTSIM